MNIYDTKIISCSQCKNEIGEVDFDAEVIRPLCGKCSNPMPKGDNILYTINYLKSSNLKKPEVLIPAWRLSIAQNVVVLW